MDGVILINPFEVPEGKEDAFVARWQDAAAYLRQQEGFVSTRLHRSLDPSTRFTFVNVAVWESAQHFRRAVSSPQFREMAGTMPFPSHPALYRIDSE